MSGIDDCASQEIEASTSSNSTRNSMKYSFVRAILKADDCQTLCNTVPRTIVSTERVPQLPRLEKKDFIQNWIIAHSNPGDSPEKSYPGSPILGISSSAKRSPQSPILGYRWKRIKRETGGKENCRVSLNEKFQEAKLDFPVITRIKIEQEIPQISEPELLDDTNKTLTFGNSPILNGITNSRMLNASRVSSSWLRGSKSPRKFDTNLKRNDCQSLVRESSEVPDALSLSSPLAERSGRLKIDNLKKESHRRYQILAEETPLEDEIIWSSSNIPETLSSSTIVDDHKGLEVDSKIGNYHKTEADISKLEKLQIRPFCFSPIKLKAETSSSYVRRSQVLESSISSNRSSPLLVNNLTDVKSNNIASPVFDRFSKTCESSQIRENLVTENSNSAKQLSLMASLTKNVTGVKSVNNSWIRVKKKSTKFQAISKPQFIDPLNNIRESSEIQNTLSGLSQIGESERIDVESNITNHPEDDIKFDSDSDATISDIIENAETQKIAELRKSSKDTKNSRFAEERSDFVERISEHHRDKTCDSDETYYSDGNSIPRLRIIDACSVTNSQLISQTTSYSHEGRGSANRSEILISEIASPRGNNNSEPPANVLVNTTNNNSKKKRKSKKGSLVAKLKNMISSQVSNLRIWRYQMSRPDFKNSRLQFVVLKIRERETRYGRHYLTALVIEDSHDLLKSLLESHDNSLIKKPTVTIVMIPEIIGVFKIGDGSGLKIFPPWEVMDYDRRILNVTFFNVIASNEINVENKTAITRESKRIIEDFECPCIRAKRLVDSCPEKFRNTKPSVMQAMFEF